MIRSINQICLRVYKNTYVVVGATLASGEDSIVNTLLKVSRVLEILPEENKTGAGATESLMTRK